MHFRFRIRFLMISTFSSEQKIRKKTGSLLNMLNGENLQILKPIHSVSLSLFVRVNGKRNYTYPASPAASCTGLSSASPMFLKGQKTEKSTLTRPLRKQCEPNILERPEYEKYINIYAPLYRFKQCGSNILEGQEYEKKY